MRLSVREVSLLARRCFVANGFAQGPADAAAAAVRWTELYRDAGLDTLHRLLDDLPDLDRSAVSLVRRDGRAVVLDTDDQPSIVAATPALDVADSRADQHGVGLSYASVARDDPTRPTIGHVAYRGAGRGLVTVVLYTDGTGGATTAVAVPDRPQPSLAEAAFDAPSVAHAKLATVVDDGLCGPPDAPLKQCFFERARTYDRPTADERIVARLLTEATEPDPDADLDAGFLTLCLDPRHVQYAAGVEDVVATFLTDREDRFTRTFRPVDAQARIDERLDAGVEVDRDVWRDLFEVSSEVLAPEFEGSKEGAGFALDG